MSRTDIKHKINNRFKAFQKTENDQILNLLGKLLLANRHFCKNIS